MFHKNAFQGVWGGALNKEFLTESTDKPKGYMFKLVAY
jgi:hypothetical protein